MTRINEAQPIMIVEDSMDDFDATRRAFSKANLRNPLIHALSGQQALDYLERGENLPGIILLDLNMPGIDGRQTLKMIKQNYGLKQIPIVILTTSDDQRDVQACYELGANTYIQKPVDFDGLIAATRQLKEYWFEFALLPKGADHG